MRCLVIEDDTQTAHYICNSLRESGHEILHSPDARDGLDQALHGVWDMVILDRLLPGGLDGLTIVEQMRALHIVTPVLVISALTAIDERVRGLRAGGDDYLTKPFAMSELLARIEALVRRATTQPERTRLKVADLCSTCVRSASRAARASYPCSREKYVCLNSSCATRAR